MFVSDKSVPSTSQSCLLKRQNLLNVRQIKRVTEIAGTIINNGAAGAKHLIALDQTDGPNEKITVTRAERLDQLCGLGVSKRGFRGWVQDVTIAAIQTAGNTLKPGRYLSLSPVDLKKPPEMRIADLFDIIRPKTTSMDPVGKRQIREVWASDISEFDEVTGGFRKFTERTPRPLRAH